MSRIPPSAEVALEQHRRDCPGCAFCQLHDRITALCMGGGRFERTLVARFLLEEVERLIAAGVEDAA